MHITNFRTGGDYGNELEISGKLHAVRLRIVNGEFERVDYRKLFDRSSEDPIILSQGASYLINQPGQRLWIRPDEFLRLTGVLWDDDGILDIPDLMTPVPEKTYPYSALGPGEPFESVVRFEEDDQIVDATFRIEYIRSHL
jgi:hypothetical protein